MAEVDVQTWTWTLPAERSKNGRPRVTPLAGLARDIVEKRLADADGPAIFLAETGATLTAAHVGHFLLSRRDKLPIGSFTTHDLRRTVATHVPFLPNAFNAAELEATMRVKGNRFEGLYGLKYLNGGVELFDVDAFVDAEIERKAMELLRGRLSNPQVVDQSLINAVLRGNWLELSPRAT